MFGKWHNTPEPEISPAGPFDRWPTGLGFDYFYGFNQGETHQYYPVLYRNTTPVPQPKSPEQGYHFTADMTDEAIAWTRNVRAADRDKPWFVYFSTSGVHAPHHAPKEWRDKYKGKFDHGWDKQREMTHAKQLEIGIIPKGTKLTPRPKEIPAWDEPVAGREEGLRPADGELRRVHGLHRPPGRPADRQPCRQSGELDNTLVMYIVGDNGASAEGGLEGTFSEVASLIGIQLGLESTIKRLDEIGGPTSEPHVPVGWAWAMDAPFQWTKQVASHFGGTRNPMVVHWPKGIKAKGEIRTQFHHVIDVVPTILEACKIPEPKVVNGIPQKPIEGVSMLYSFDDANAKGRRTTQYFETGDQPGDLPRRLGGVQPYGLPWDTAGRGDDFIKAPWELYNIEADFSQADDLAAKEPEKLKELQAKFLEEAKKYDVFPLDPRFAERFDPKLRESGEPNDELDLLRQQRPAARADRAADLPARAHHHRRTDRPEGRSRGSDHLRRGVLGRLVAVRQGWQAELPVHVLRHRRRDNPRHDSPPRGQGDVEDRVHPGRLEGGRRHAQAVRQRQAGRRGQAEAVGVPARAGAVRGRPRFDHARSTRPTRTKASSSFTGQIGKVTFELKK